MQISQNQIAEMEQRFRATLINSVPGYKCLQMVGTSNKDGISNIGLFNSIFHLGANPALLGMVFRPLTPEHDTFNNIMETGHYTFNNVLPGFYKQAHQTSASYPSEVSEFSICGFTKQYLAGFKAPFVQESNIKIGLEFRECIDINVNDTKILIGEVVHILLDGELLGEDGYVDHAKAETVTVAGLDSYFATQPLERLAYAKADGNLIQQASQQKV
jgi:flavin reductase (DIM6/NTAB) family NADH-FMN oxidoreductase RutF